MGFDRGSRLGILVATPGEGEAESVEGKEGGGPEMALRPGKVLHR